MIGFETYLHGVIYLDLKLKTIDFNNIIIYFDIDYKIKCKNISEHFHM